MMSTKKTVVILAGGLGSRYQGLKQIDGILENGSPILEYSIYDAIQSGFTKVVFIINEKIPQLFLDKINSIFAHSEIEIFWVYQNLEKYIPKEISIENRVKPWGTAHAVLCAKEIVNEPFVVINADDFYGRESYKKAALLIEQGQINPQQQCLIAYPTQNTLSPNGAVSRGVCSINQDGFLASIQEKTHILNLQNQIVYLENNQHFPISKNTLVSMNFWIFDPSIFQFIEKYFNSFLLNYKNQEEFYIPSFVQNMIDNQECNVLVKASPADWMGVTYPEDKAILQVFLRQLIQQKKYPEILWTV